MFTGIVEEVGKVARLTIQGNSGALTVTAQKVTHQTQLGDSIAVNGVCLTVTHLSATQFAADVSPETLRRTNLGTLKPGQPVNLERALTPTTRMGGHIVQGHVDGTAEVTAVRREQDALWFTFHIQETHAKYLVPKGFICLDGASLTVVDVTKDSFTLMLVPFTQKHMTLAQRKPGYRANMEVDILGKYVEKLLQHREKPTLGAGFLQEHGFI